MGTELNWAELIQSTTKANSGLLHKGDFEQMARRRFQDPTPFKEGNWWWIFIREDQFRDGQLKRVAKRVKVAPANKGEREAKRLAGEYLRPMNQGLQMIGGATSFENYVRDIYIPNELPLMAKTTVARYNGISATRAGQCGGIIAQYLMPQFGHLCLRDLTPKTIQSYFSGMCSTTLSYESVDKIRDVLSSILGSAMRKYQLLVTNPMENIALPRKRTGRKKTKPVITFEQFDQMIDLIAEPYATMLYVAVYSGLRVSELIGLKWNDVGENSLMVDERYCRGDWSAPKSEASCAPVYVPEHVIHRIHALKDKAVTVRNGGHGAKKTIACVKSATPEDLVFQGLRKGGAMRDNNILTRHIKPAARVLGIEFVNWRCLRTSCATWLKKAGADPKDIQGQMRHSRISTTMEIYVQDIPESRRMAVSNMPARRVM